MWSPCGAVAVRVAEEVTQVACKAADVQGCPGFRANYRVHRSRKLPMTASGGQWQTIATEEMRREEQASDPSSPMAEITDTFEMHLCLVTATVARFWGLEINQDTPDFDALEALLKTRYGYWDDDIEHMSYFIHFQAG